MHRLAAIALVTVAATLGGEPTKVESEADPYGAVAARFAAFKPAPVADLPSVRGRLEQGTEHALAGIEAHGEARSARGVVDSLPAVQGDDFSQGNGEPLQRLPRV